MKLFYTLIALLGLPGSLLAQSADLNGTWQGGQSKALLYMKVDITTLNLSLTDSVFTGTSTLNYQRGHNKYYELHRLKGRLRPDGRMELFETLVSTNFPPDQITSGVYDLRLFRTDTSLVLAGTWHNKGRSPFSRSRVRFERLLPKKDSARAPFADSSKPAPSPTTQNGWANPAQRRTTQQGQVALTPAQARQPIALSLFDNGEIDGDTVSVYYNDRLLFARVALGHQALTHALQLDAQASRHELVFVAHNLGRLPPNTGLLVVTLPDGKRHELSLSADEKTNAVVRLIIQP